MARPKKIRFLSEDRIASDFFNGLPEERLPGEIYLLQATVGALISRIRRMDEETSRQLAVFIELLASRWKVWSYWKAAKLPMRDPAREWKEHHDVLMEIALGKKTKRTHCKETLLIQSRMLDRHTAELSDFTKCRNLLTKKDWFAKKAPFVNSLLTVVPCFCNYDGKLIERVRSSLANDGLKEVFVQPIWFDKFLAKPLTKARVRNAWLAMLHVTTESGIEKIKKWPSSFTSHEIKGRNYCDFLWTNQL